MPDGHPTVRSYLAVPVTSRTGEVLGGLFFGHPEAGVFAEEDERIAVGVAAQAAVAIDNARLYKEAQESGRRFRQLADAMPQIVWTARPDGYLDYYNRRWYEFTGLPEGEGGDESWRPILHPDDLQRCLDRWYESVRTGQPYDIEYRFRDCRTGEYRWHLGRALPVRDESSEIVKWYGTSTDIDDRKRAEEALVEADRHKDEFLATLAHELRNPLAPIRNSLHILKSPEADRALAEPVWEMMERQVHNMTRLVDDLMDVSRINWGKIELRKEEVDLASVVRRAVEASMPLIKERRHDLRLDLPDEPIRLEGDPTRLEQVLDNLLNNAAKYTDPGGRIWLAAALEGDFAVIRVRDTGIGIEPEMLPKVFGLFVQAERRLDRSKGGLGIGLSLVRQLVEMHGGTIQAHSEGPGRGTEFVVRLPALVEGGSPSPRIAPRRRTAGVLGPRQAPDPGGGRQRRLGPDDGPAAGAALEAGGPGRPRRAVGPRGRPRVPPRGDPARHRPARAQRLRGGRAAAPPARVRRDPARGDDRLGPGGRPPAVPRRRGSTAISSSRWTPTRSGRILAHAAGVGRVTSERPLERAGSSGLMNISRYRTASGNPTIEDGMSTSATPGQQPGLVFREGPAGAGVLPEPRPAAEAGLPLDRVLGQPGPGRTAHRARTRRPVRPPECGQRRDPHRPELPVRPPVRGRRPAGRARDRLRPLRVRRGPGRAPERQAGADRQLAPARAGRPDLHRARLDSVATEAERHEWLCALNVVEQAANVCRTTVVQDAWARGQALTVHGLIYGLKDGLLRDLGMRVSSPEELDARREEALVTTTTVSSDKRPDMSNLA